MNQTAVKLMISLEYDDGTLEPTSTVIAEALASALPKEWWASSREDTWGVIAIHPLNKEGDRGILMPGEKAAKLLMENLNQMGEDA
jgi:hypothetical protein